MLIKRMKTGDRGDEFRVGDATIHVRKVGEGMVELSIDAPPSVVISHTPRSAAPPARNPVDE